MKRALARSSLLTTAMLGLRVLSQAAVLVLLTRLLGPQMYGNFVAATALAVVLGLLPNLGAGFVMLDRSARHADGVAQVWRYAWPMTVALGTILLAVYMAIAPLLTTSLLPTHVLLLLGAAELLLTPFTLLLSFALQARERVPLSQLVQWLPLALRVVAALGCFWLAPADRLGGYVALQLLASLLGLAIGFRVAARHVQLDWRPRRVTVAELRHGASFAAMNLIAANPTELDKMLSVRLVGAHDAGIYAATARVVGATVTPVIGLLLSSQPRLFRHAHAPTRAGHRLVGLIALLALGWGVISGVLLALLAPWLPRLFGPSFAGTATLMLWLAAVAPLLALRLAAGTVLVALGKPLQRIGFELAGIAVLVTAMLLLAPPLGTRGLALALIAAEASMAAIGWWLSWRRLTAPLSAPTR